MSLSMFQALELAAQATEAGQFKDWWWKVQLGKCYYRLIYKNILPNYVPLQTVYQIFDMTIYLWRVFIIWWTSQYH